MGERSLKLDASAAILANVLIIGVWGIAATLHANWQDVYYSSAQEDEILEWGTFWAFGFAAGVCLHAGGAQRRAGILAPEKRFAVPWFLFGVALFCAFVAMEEISWGQRIFAYRPPAYFLEHNFQQELNFHNMMSTSARKLALKAVILGYGVALPLAAMIPPVKRWLAWVGVVVPPLALVPSFIATYVLYQRYDGFSWLWRGDTWLFQEEELKAWSLTGEWVELMLGLGFLFAALAAWYRGGHGPPRAGPRQAWVIAIGGLLVVAAGAASATLSRAVRDAAPGAIEAARGELEALKRDFQSGRVATRCNRHKRLYTFQEKYDQDFLLEGAFASLTVQGLPEDRASFFLDPWNSPYWIRDRCASDEDRRIVFLYSFGPNRRRDSSRWEILGDDVGTVVYDGTRRQGVTRRR